MKEENLGIEIIKTLKYYSIFRYPPTQHEIYAFLNKKYVKLALKNRLGELVKEGRVIRKKYNNIYKNNILLKSNAQISLQTNLTAQNTYRYTLGEYSIFHNIYEEKEKESIKKIQKIVSYVTIVSNFPQIKLIGLSGTMAMMNVKENDDIDLFIITAKNRLWTGRLIALFLAQVYGLRRTRKMKKAKDKVCLNLFFDEKDLKVPEFKKTEYIAREILQMKPVYVKNNIYDELLRENRWIYNFFPNAEKKTKNIKKNKKESNNIFSNFFEKVVKIIQLNIIKVHQTNEIISDTQLWFFPKDFEQKLHKIRKKEMI